MIDPLEFALVGIFMCIMLLGPIMIKLALDWEEFKKKHKDNDTYL